MKKVMILQAVKIVAAKKVIDKILIQIIYCPTNAFAVRVALKKKIFFRTKI
jgi:hypothetical protein